MPFPSGLKTALLFQNENSKTSSKSSYFSKVGSFKKIKKLSLLLHYDEMVQQPVFKNKNRGQHSIYETGGARTPKKYKKRE